jgi:hypothetical protein
MQPRPVWPSVRRSSARPVNRQVILQLLIAAPASQRRLVGTPLAVRRGSLAGTAWRGRTHPAIERLGVDLPSCPCTAADIAQPPERRAHPLDRGLGRPFEPLPAPLGGEHVIDEDLGAAVRRAGASPDRADARLAIPDLSASTGRKRRGSSIFRAGR